MFGKKILGIDVGGSGIKGAPVEIAGGKMLTERYRIPTPADAKPDDIAEIIGQIVKYFNWRGPVGIGFPAAIRDGVALTAANIHKSWIGTHIPTLVKRVAGVNSAAINDADAAGLAEMRFGAGQDKSGTVMVITVGTGLGTAMFFNGTLFPNTELGHIEMQGKDAEKYASDFTRKNEELDWADWAGRFNEYLITIEKLFWPRMIIVGGGVSKKHEKFFQYLNINAELVPAQLRNEAGIIGAAVWANQLRV
ncbi:MAG: polyphosphate glucokinase [Spirochaetes bacterium GWF1_51_8]|nr:MAG: polyphosphate glucokinase [Spirochaetes bacterium GWF1_51_8]